MTNVNNVKVGSREFKIIKDQYPDDYELISQAFDDGKDDLALLMTKQVVVFRQLQAA